MKISIKRDYLFFIKIIIVMVCFFLMVCIHDTGHYLYTQHYRTHSRGYSIGYVVYYMNWFILPSFFLVAFLKRKWGITVMIGVLFLLLYWFVDYYPLRTLLVFLSSLLPYAIIFCMNGWLERRMSFKKGEL